MKIDVRRFREYDWTGVDQMRERLIHSLDEKFIFELAEAWAQGGVCMGLPWFLFLSSGRGGGGVDFFCGPLLLQPH